VRRATSRRVAVSAGAVIVVLAEASGATTVMMGVALAVFN
jgi:hypothetical protein